MGICLMLVFALTVVHMSSFYYRAANLQKEEMLAREAAQAGLAETGRRLSLNPELGGTGEKLTEQLGAANYTVDFSLSSRNNLGQLHAATTTDGRDVPPNTALICSVGESPNGTRRTVQALVALEALPFPVQSTGRVDGTTVTIAGAASLADVQSGAPPLPGSIYAGSSASDAVRLNGVSTLTGDLRTPGHAQLDPLVTVLGEVQENAAPVEVPDLDITSFENSSQPGVTVISGGTYNCLTNPIRIGAGLPAVHTLRGPIFVDGDITLIGPVLLDQAQIFVANGGNLKIAGIATGQGSLFVTGKTTLTAGTVLRNEDRIAVFSQSDLEILAGGVFQGVLYTKARLTVGLGLTVVGAVVAHGGDISLGSLCQVVHLPEYTSFASYWLARGGVASVKLRYWGEIP